MGLRFSVDILSRPKIVLGGIIILAIINGLLFITFMPPWQHYDEPGHFEYAWLLANRVGLPQAGEYDQAMRREVAASMVEHDFYAGMEARPNLLAMNEPVWIGMSQIDDPPVYYWLVSLPLRLVRTSDITFQLYLGRLVSLSLYIVTILAAYLTVAELTRPASDLRWLFPITMILLPGFTDLMTAVNNDVGAVAFFSLFIWLCVRVIRRCGDWLPLAGMVVLAILCFFIKNTVMIAVALALIAGLFALLRGRWRPAAWGILGCLMLGVMIVSLRWNGAAAWYTPEAGSAFLRRHTSDGNSLGARFLQLTLSQLSPTQVLQPLPPDQVAELRGESITLGAWVWATYPMQAYTPVLSDGIGNYFETIAISTTPAFYSFLAQVPENVDHLMIALKAPATPKDGEIYYDGLVMIKGDYRGSEPGLFNLEGETIQWNGSPLTNLLRNPSFEKAWLEISPDINLHLLRWFRYEPSLVLTSLSDWKGSEWYYKVTFGNLFRTFWAKFGWGHIFLVGQKPYRVLMTVTLLSGLGAIAAFWRLKRAFSLELWVFMGIALTVVWGVAATRGIDSLFGNVFIPGSRYAYPVIVLTLLLLCAGWREVLQYFGKWLHLPSQVQYSIYLALFIFLDGYSIYTIAQYYTRVP